MGDENKKVVPISLMEKLAKDFEAKQKETNDRIETLVTAGGEPNKIDAISVNGTAVPIEGKTVNITVLTEEQVNNAINAKVSSTYKAGGSVAFADLPELAEANMGLVVNVTNKFTTTDSFVEGAGNKHPAGTNVVVVLAGTEYKYDVLSGFVDLSGLVEKEPGKGLSTNDYTNEDKTKLDGIEFATEEDYNAMIERVFGTGGGGTTEPDQGGEQTPESGE